MRKKKVSFLFLLLGMIFILVIACEKEEITNNYLNDEYGYTFEIPDIWKDKKDKIEIVEDAEGRVVTFAYLFESDEVYQDGSLYQQDLFTIAVMSKDDYEKAINDPPFTGDFLGEREHLVYILYMSLDNIILDKETIDEFNELNLSVDEIKERFSLNGEKDLLVDEIAGLKAQISKKDEEINRLRRVITGKDVELKELWESVNMIRFSAYARLDDYNESFDNLREVYRINSKYEIKDDWYLINDDYFEIELLGYEDAIKVDLYTLRLESGEGPLLIFSDTNYTDGWMYTNDSIGEIIEKHNYSKGFSYEPYFVIYAEATLGDGSIIRTSNLPMYYR